MAGSGEKKAGSLGQRIPEDGIVYDVSPGKTLTRIHLDISQEGVTLASVGAAAGGRALAEGNRQRLTLKRAQDGVVLSLVGAASGGRQ